MNISRLISVSCLLLFSGGETINASSESNTAAANKFTKTFSKSAWFDSIDAPVI